MLVLARREQQSIQIGDSITIKVLRVDRGNVTLGIAAPREIPILRDDAKEIVRKQGNPVLSEPRSGEH